MSEPIISVVIPTYNSSSFVIKTLDCLKTQTFNDFEVVIVNDGSDDGTQEIISKYITSNSDFKIRLFNQKNRGIAGARNKGILESKGQYIAFLDHDDIWYPDKLSRCFEIFRKYPEIDLVCHNEIMRDTSGMIIRRLKYGPHFSEMFRRLLFKGNCLSTSATVVKKNVLLAEDLFRERLDFFSVEDYDLWLRLSKRYNFYFIKDVLGEYIMRENSASLDLEKNYNNQISVIKQNFVEYERKKAMDYPLIIFRISRLYLLIVRDVLRKGKIAKALYYLSKALLTFPSYITAGR